MVHVGDERSNPNPRGNGVSISDVANEASVSIATVSRVLNNPEKVAPSTAERVHEAIRRLKYRPNLFAKGLVTRRSGVLGVSLPNLHGDFYSELMRSADDRAHELGYHLLVTSSAHEPDAESGRFASDLIDALVTLVTESSQLEGGALVRSRVPVVMLGASPGEASVDTVTIDNGSGTREAAAHLLGGTPGSRCYVVAGHAGNLDSDARCRAFAEALTRSGIEVGTGQVVHGEYSVEWGWEWARRMIRGGELAGAAVLAGNDEIAVGVIDAARDEGLDVPGDVRVVGFDDSRVCGLLRPTLSSVNVPVRDVARAGIEAAARRLADPDAPPIRITLPTRLIVRESSRPGEGAPARGTA